MSRIERQQDLKVSTLRSYTEDLSGELHLVVTLPDGETYRVVPPAAD